MTGQIQLHELLSNIGQAKAKIDSVRPLPPYTVKSLHDKLALDWTYHSNAIEGNTLTLRETKVVLEGITVGGKTIREHLEAVNHYEAISYVEEIVARQLPLSEWVLKNIHGLVLNKIDSQNAGRYRQENVVITGASTTAPDHLHLPNEMHELMNWYSASQDLHPVERAAELHTRFVKIHPFVDGNGRTARLLMNLELIKEGYPPAVIRKEDREAYYSALDEACSSGNFDSITRLVSDATQRSIDIYISLLGLNREETLEHDDPSGPSL